MKPTIKQFIYFLKVQSGPTAEIMEENVPLMDLGMYLPEVWVERASQLCGLGFTPKVESISKEWRKKVDELGKLQ